MIKKINLLYILILGVVVFALVYLLLKSSQLKQITALPIPQIKRQQQISTPQKDSIDLSRFFGDVEEYGRSGSAHPNNRFLSGM